MVPQLKLLAEESFADNPQFHLPRRLIVYADSPTAMPAGPNARERDKITNHLKAKGWQVWHWVEHLWLVVAPRDAITAKQLTNEIITILGSQQSLIVMEIEGSIEFSGVGAKESWPWMYKNWGQGK